MHTFDRFADWTAERASSAGFFLFCVILVLVWLPSVLIVPERVPPVIDTWQLIINTATTVITFLMVALLHNADHRFEQATNERWSALFDHLGIEDPVDDEGQKATS